MMNQGNEWMDHGMEGLMSGGIGTWSIIGLLIILLLVVLISKAVKMVAEEKGKKQF